MWPGKPRRPLAVWREGTGLVRPRARMCSWGPSFPPPPSGDPADAEKPPDGAGGWQAALGGRLGLFRTQWSDRGPRRWGVCFSALSQPFMCRPRALALTCAPVETRSQAQVGLSPGRCRAHLCEHPHGQRSREAQVAWVQGVPGSGQPGGGAVSEKFAVSESPPSLKEALSPPSSGHVWEWAGRCRAAWDAGASPHLAAACARGCFPRRCGFSAWRRGCLRTASET